MGRIAITQPGIGTKGAFDYFQESMRMAVPLILQKNRIDFQKAKYDRDYEEAQAALKAEAEKAKFETATNFLRDAFSTAQGKGDAAGISAIAPKLEALGVPATGIPAVPQATAGPKNLQELLARKLSKEPPGKILQTIKALKKTDPNFNENKAIWDAVGGDVDEYIKYKNKLKIKGGFNENEMLWQLSGGNVDIYSRLKQKVRKGSAITPEERKRKQLEDDIQQELGRLGSVESGQDIFGGQYDVGRNEVVKRKKQRLVKMLSSYDKLYGTGAAEKRFGISQYQLAGDPLGILK